MWTCIFATRPSVPVPLVLQQGSRQGSSLHPPVIPVALFESCTSRRLVPASFSPFRRLVPQLWVQEQDPLHLKGETSMSKEKPAAQSQDPKASSPATANRPVHEVKLGKIKAAIWLNETESGKRYNVTVGRLYRDGDSWKLADSFGREDLPLLIKVLDLAHSWIYQSQPSTE
jgi:hypothetical protein